MVVTTLKPLDIISVLDNPSLEAKEDMRVFGSTAESLISKALDAYPFSWSIGSPDKIECVCWYNVRGNKAITSMLYSDGFLKNKHITLVIKDIIEKNADIAKQGGIETVEIHSTLFHPLSDSWYQRLGFTKTNKTYQLNGRSITIFERRL